MKYIKPLKHYAIPPKCQNDNSGCPFNPDIYMPKAWENRYTQLMLDEGNKVRDEKTGTFTPQGGCTDGTYIYRAMVEHDDQPTKLQKLDMQGNVILEKTNTSYGHANDMTYCSKDNLLYIAHSSSTSIVYKVNPETLELVDTINIGKTIWGISYNATDDLFVLGGVGDSYLSVYTYDFSFMYRIKEDNAFTGLVRQGIDCTANYIFVALDNGYGAISEDAAGSRIMVYTWNGMFIKSIYLDIKEIEFVAVHGSKLIIGTYEGRDLDDVKSGKLFIADFDLYPGQTVQTGRPTDVSGGLNNLHRLPEGTPVRLWKGSVVGEDIVLNLPQRLRITEDGPFRYLRFRFKGANQQTFDWYPADQGVVCLSEFDLSHTDTKANFTARETRFTFDEATQTFKIETAKGVQNDGAVVTPLTVMQIWGII